MVRAVDPLYVNFAVHELLARNVEVLRCEADSRVPRIDLNPLKVMIEEPFAAEVRSG